MITAKLIFPNFEPTQSSDVFGAKRYARDPHLLTLSSAALGAVSRVGPVEPGFSIVAKINGCVYESTEYGHFFRLRGMLNV